MLLGKKHAGIGSNVHYEAFVHPTNNQASAGHHRSVVGRSVSPGSNLNVCILSLVSVDILIWYF